MGLGERSFILPNPIIAASGTFGHGDELAALCDPAQLGAVTVKSLSAEPWPGNSAPRVCSVPGGMLNSVGLQNPGIPAWINDELPLLEAAHARIIVSIWGRSLADFSRAAAMLAPVSQRIIAIEVNVSCPNVEDRSAMFAHSPSSTAEVVGAVRSQAPATPIFAKLSPNVTDICEIAQAAISAGADGLTLINTLMGLAIDIDSRRPRLGAGGGGLSGPALHSVALRMVSEVTSLLPGIPVIGTGGVSTGSHAVAMLQAGASAVGVGTATFAEPRASLRILGELTSWCSSNAVSSTAELSGTLQRP